MYKRLIITIIANSNFVNITEEQRTKKKSDNENRKRTVLYPATRKVIKNILINHESERTVAL